MSFATTTVQEQHGVTPQPGGIISRFQRTSRPLHADFTGFTKTSHTSQKTRNFTATSQTSTWLQHSSAVREIVTNNPTRLGGGVTWNRHQGVTVVQKNTFLVAFTKCGSQVIAVISLREGGGGETKKEVGTQVLHSRMPTCVGPEVARLLVEPERCLAPSALAALEPYRSHCECERPRPPACPPACSSSHALTSHRQAGHR